MVNPIHLMVSEILKDRTSFLVVYLEGVMLLKWAYKAAFYKQKWQHS